MNTKQAKRSREYLTPEEVKALLAAAKDGATRNPERDHCILNLLYNHALRASELCQLRTSDINLTGEPTIHVRHEKGGGASVHPLYKSDIAALREWLAVRQPMELAHDYLFASEQRTQINRATINLMINTVSKKAGLEHLRPHPHSFRHACGYHLLNRGQDVRTVQDYLGHRSIQTTIIYTKLSPGRFNGLGKLF